MQRILIASLLGLSVSIASSRGQAIVLFQNYGSNPVQWTADTAAAPAGQAGLTVRAADNFRVDLQWQFGTTFGDAGLAVPVGDGGIFLGPHVIIPGYAASNPITFTVLAWNGTDYAHSSATGSLSWIQPNVLGNWELPAPLIVQYVPEPSCSALIGLGLGVLAARRCRHEAVSRASD
jgi:hypothetical protein